MQLTKALAVITLIGAAQAATIPPVAPLGPDVEATKGGEQSTKMVNKILWWKREDDDDKQSTDMTNKVAWWKRDSEKEEKQSTDLTNKTLWWKREAASKDEE